MPRVDQALKPTSQLGRVPHLNLTVDRTRAELEAICDERSLEHGWRGWTGFLDVWLDEGLMVELVYRN